LYIDRAEAERFFCKLVLGIWDFFVIYTRLVTGKQDRDALHNKTARMVRAWLDLVG
jgi:hypothetical protein